MSAQRASYSSQIYPDKSHSVSPLGSEAESIAREVDVVPGESDVRVRMALAK